MEWTTPKNEQLVAMRRRGVAFAAIADEFGTTERAVANQHWKLMNPGQHRASKLRRSGEVTRGAARLPSVALADILRKRGWSCSPPASDALAAGGVVTW